MADSSKERLCSPVKVALKANGKKVEDDSLAVSIGVTKALNRVPMATIEMKDGDMALGSFPLSDKDDLKPGAAITIEAAHGEDTEPLFKGVIVRHGIEMSGKNEGRLVVECRDEAVRMTVGRKNANFIEKKDSDIIAGIIGTYQGLSADVESTTVTHKALVQYYCSDWDFILSRAEANGLVVNVENGTVTAKKPKASGSPVLTAEYGVDLIEFKAAVDVRGQIASVCGTCWDLKTQAVVQETAAAAELTARDRLKATDLAKVVGPDVFGLQSATPMDRTALKAWVEGCQVKASLARIRGTMKLRGSAKANPGTLMKLAGVGERFSGNVFATGVKHTIEGGDWTTEVTFGLSPNWFAERSGLTAPSAAGLLPGVDGLQIGVVMKLDGDPEGENRIKVSVPVLKAETDGVWARLACGYASEGFGSMFAPEIGDEVVLGYFNGDPCHPVVLGSLYSSKRKAPVELSAENKVKTLVTKSKLTVQLDEEKKSITITTPGKNSVVLSDDAKSIQLKDQNGNTVTLADGGIAIDSAKDVKISAKGKVSIDAIGEVAIASKADVKLTGLNVTAQANVGFSAKGSATAELSASGQTTVKGALVMIN